jgi:hypothetical protein
MAYEVRVPLLEPEKATGENARFFQACTTFRGRVANSAKLWGHIPHIAKFQLLGGILPQREGAGAMLSSKIKEMGVLKTSHVNSCAY